MISYILVSNNVLVVMGKKTALLRSSEIHSFLSNKLIFSFSCVISSRHISWTSKWSPSKNWQTGWPTCGAWELLKTAWLNTCLTNTPLARKAAKHKMSLKKELTLCVFKSCFHSIKPSAWHRPVLLSNIYILNVKAVIVFYCHLLIESWHLKPVRLQVSVHLLCFTLGSQRK